MATSVKLPRYVEYGGRATAPGPFDCRGGRFRGLLLKGDKAAIDGWVDAALNEPAHGAVAFRAPSATVLLMNGWFESVRASTPPFDGWGVVREVQLSLWIPLVVGREKNGRFVGERLGQAVPFIFVDNPMSYAGGRETYGYPKSLGRFGFEDGIDGVQTVDAYGGSFKSDNVADWHRVVTLTPPDGDARERSEGGPLEGTEALVEHLTQGALDPDQETILPGGLQVLVDAAKDALAGRSNQIFLKQFRDAHEPEAACFQQIVRAPVTITSRKTRWALEEWTVDIDEIASHPIGGELGVTSQKSWVTYSMDIDFICERGEPIAP